MRQWFVDVEKFYTLRLVVQLDRLQTWDVFEKGGSGQAAKNQHFVVFVGQFPNVNRITEIIVDCDIG